MLKRQVNLVYNIGKEKNPNHICCTRASDPGHRIQNPAFYRVTRKAGFYPKAVEVYPIPKMLQVDIYELCFYALYRSDW